MGQRRLYDARGDGEDGLVSDFGARFHEVGKDAGHATVGNEIGDDGAMRVGPLASGAEEDGWVSEWYVSPAGDDFEAGGY